MADALVEVGERGMWCERGGFHVDPWVPVERAVITHAHADHAVAGCGAYVCAEEGAGVLARRVQAGAKIETRAYGQAWDEGAARVSLHPAGHLLGSAQVRVEASGSAPGGGGVTVVSGDYKVEPDATCAAFEVVACDTFITESTFGLPIYRWPDAKAVFAEMVAWWAENAAAGRTTVVYAYALGKAQRLLAGLAAGVERGLGPILEHGAMRGLTQAYREAGVALPETGHATAEAVRAAKKEGRGLLVIAPPSANGTAWVKKLRPMSSALASGWMAVRGRRRFRAVDRGFVVSDHADWPGLLATIEATGASRVGVTHGYREELVRYLNERGGVEGYVVPARYEGELGEENAEKQKIEKSENLELTVGEGGVEGGEG
ncbi:MAG: ligase-associated DNA damage response exonuclease [Planctomycetota bacterium]